MTTIGKPAAVRAAVVQAGAVPFDPDACVEKAVRLVGEAAARGAKVVVFPEAFVPGYPKGLSYGLVVGARDPAGREEFRIYLEAAITVPGAHTQRLGEAAAAHGVHLVIGVIERDGGTCYCTVLFFGPDGSLLGKHRKLMPTALERMIWGFGDGSTLTAVESPYGRIGAVICWENYMPMLRMAMYAKNVALYCAPTADDRDTWLPSMRHGRSKGAASCSPPASSSASATSRRACASRSGTRRIPSSCAAAAPSWARSDRCSRAPISRASRSSPRTWTSPRSAAASSTSMSWATTAGPTSSSSW